MKTNLPESRNRNLPPPPPAAAAVRPHRSIQPPPPAAPARTPSPFRSVIAFLLIAGLLGTGLWYFIKASREDARVQEQLEMALTDIGLKLYATGLTLSLGTETDEQAKDLADLPRIVNAVKIAAPRMVPAIKIIDGDPFPGTGVATHQIAYLFNDQVGFVIRVRYDAKSGGFIFIGQANRLKVPSRKELEEKAAAAATPPLPAASPTPQSTLPAGNGTAETAPPAPAAAVKEKVSEEPVNPQ